jgi:hypothetical protein
MSMPYISKSKNFVSPLPNHPRFRLPSTRHQKKQIRLSFSKGKKLKSNKSAPPFRRHPPVQTETLYPPFLQRENTFRFRHGRKKKKDKKTLVTDSASLTLSSPQKEIRSPIPPMTVSFHFDK